MSLRTWPLSQLLKQVTVWGVAASWLHQFIATVVKTRSAGVTLTTTASGVVCDHRFALGKGIFASHQVTRLSVPLAIAHSSSIIITAFPSSLDCAHPVSEPHQSNSYDAATEVLNGLRYSGFLQFQNFTARSAARPHLSGGAAAAERRDVRAAGNSLRSSCAASGILVVHDEAAAASRLAHATDYVSTRPYGSHSGRCRRTSPRCGRGLSQLLQHEWRLLNRQYL